MKPLYMVLCINKGRAEDRGAVVPIYPNVYIITPHRAEAERVAEAVRQKAFCITATVYGIGSDTLKMAEED